MDSPLENDEEDIPTLQVRPPPLPMTSEEEAHIHHHEGLTNNIPVGPYEIPSHVPYHKVPSRPDSTVTVTEGSSLGIPSCLEGGEVLQEDEVYEGLENGGLTCFDVCGCRSGKCNLCGS